MQKLVIVEAPGKVRTIQGCLPPGYRVEASVGHFRDLPLKGMGGVEPPDFRPVYEITKPDVVKRLKAAAKKASEVILATDLDREGEAIAWHLAEVLGLKNPPRIVYSELSADAIQEALATPRSINLNLVKAQEGRRCLDRLVGYRVSGALSRITGMRLSAGRVQTPTLMIIVERERERLNFQSIEHYGVRATFLSDHIEWVADWDFSNLVVPGQGNWLEKTVARQVSALRDFEVIVVDKKEARRGPPPPFITSSMQQAASTRLGIRIKRVMELAQILYKEGLITYHRSDAPHMSEKAVKGAWEQLKKDGLGGHCSEQINTWKAKKGAQEAHDCIRPTEFARKATDLKAINPKLDDKTVDLYELIWRRAVASQMKPRVTDVTTTRLRTQEQAGGRQHEFVATGTVEKFAGWQAIYRDDDDKNEKPLPALSVGTKIRTQATELQVKHTKPPSRYTEATLVKKLEDEGIGRPSTYSAIIDGLYQRRYIEQDPKKKLVPNELAFKVVDALVGRFQFADLAYTSGVEEQLDLAAAGQFDPVDLLRITHAQLDTELQSLPSDGIGVQAKSVPCPKSGCDGQLILRPGPKGNFWGCTNYPECRETKPDNQGEPGEREPITGDSRYPCPECGGLLALRPSAKGKFWGCTNYPSCKFTLDNYRGKPTQHQCPDCGKLLKKRKASKGQYAGMDFWGCTGFPLCKFTTGDFKGKPKIE